jgi:sn-1 stearoyl-lipid 9-desaturase
MITRQKAFQVPEPAHSLEATGPTEAQSVELALAAHAGMVRAPRMLERAGTDAVSGSVHWAPAKSLWIGGMTAIALVLGPLTATPGAVLLFIVTTAVTVCLGHSLGMHRRLIHRAYDAPIWLEHLFVYLGTLVGMGGPFGMIRQHDIRDWAQRKPQCHAFLSHGTSMLNDYWWQNHCDLRLVRPPDLVIEPKVANDRFYRFIDRTQRWQQVPWAVLFYMLGGWPFVVWGIAVRVAASVTGHWLIGYLAHNGGARGWHVKGSGVQGYNVPWSGLVTMGESYHNNHHAFPGSARLGLLPGQIDPGWLVLKVLARLGLVSGLQEPATLPPRAALVPLSPAAAQVSGGLG